MIAHDIILRPLITEKTGNQKKVSNQISFEVNQCANRIEIGRAIQNIFNVKVAKVQTIQVKGKRVRRGKVIAKRKDWKKAIIKLMPGERIEFFEGA